MSLGYRVFLIQDQEVHKISQKRFNSLYLKKSESMPGFAGQTVISVLVVYELAARKPDCVVRMDTQKIRFDADGFVDEAYENEGLQLAASKMDDLLGNLNIQSIQNDQKMSSQEENSQAQDSQAQDSQGSVVDAGRRFDERRWNQRHPDLSGPVLKKVLAGVFGPSG